MYKDNFPEDKLDEPALGERCGCNKIIGEKCKCTPIPTYRELRTFRKFFYNYERNHERSRKHQS